MSSLPAGLLLFDTGIYIRFSRGEKYFWLGEDAQIFQRTILTAVVAASSTPVPTANKKSEPWMNFVRLTVPWAISLLPRAPPGLTPAFCFAAPAALSGKWILSAIFVIY